MCSLFRESGEPGTEEASLGRGEPLLEHLGGVPGAVGDDMALAVAARVLILATFASVFSSSAAITDVGADDRLAAVAAGVGVGAVRLLKNLER